VFSVLGALALFLALVGVYGVKAYAVARRTREIGIRLAVGATSRHVLWLVLREGVAMTVAGVGIGLLLAAGVARLLYSILYGVSATDPLIFSVAPALLAAAALLATFRHDAQPKSIPWWR
jgi:ABC-type antimicrobial peptide transport system permease subunit